MQLANSDVARPIVNHAHQPLISRVFRSYISLEWQAHLVVVLAFLAMVFVQLVSPLYWGAGDPLDHYRLARLLLHKPGGLYSPWRPPGMALFYILSGVAWLDTFKIFIALYAAMSAAIPILIYAILRRYSHTWALVAAVIAIFGAVPYAYSRVAEPEELFHFLHFVVLALVASYFVKPASRTLPYAICLSMFALNLVRPVAALYYWIFLVCAVVVVRRHLKHVVLATVVYVGLMGGWALADRYYGASIFPTVYAPETLRQRLFGEVYFSGGQYQFVPERPPVAMIKPEDGPASAEMYAGLRWFVQNHPDEWKRPTSERPSLLFGRFADTPEQLVHEVVSKPNFAYFDFLRHALQARNGNRGMDRLMHRIAGEHGNTGVWGILGYFVHTPTKLLVGGMPPFGGRNLLGIFYLLPQRSAMNRIYSLTWGLADLDQRLLDDYKVNPTPDKMDRLYKETTGHGLDLLNPQNGPASMEFFNAFHLFVKAYPGYWQDTNPWLHRYKGNPEGLFRATFDSADPYFLGMYEGFYWEALLKYYGIGPADRLFFRVALETMKTYPYSAAIFWDNALHITLLRTISDIKWRSQGPEKFWLGDLTYLGDIIYPVGRNDATGLTPGLRAELKEVLYDNRYVHTIGVAYAAMHLLAPVFFIAAIVLFPFALLGPAWRLAVFLAVAYVYNVAVIAVFGNFSAPRYEDVFILMPLMLACLGAQTAISMFKRRLRREGAPSPP